MRAARHKVWFGLQSTGSSPCSLKGLVASLYAAHKKAGVLQAPAQCVFCPGV